MIFWGFFGLKRHQIFVSIVVGDCFLHLFIIYRLKYSHRLLLKCRTFIQTTAGDANSKNIAGFLIVSISEIQQLKSKQSKRIATFLVLLIASIQFTLNSNGNNFDKRRKSVKCFTIELVLTHSDNGSGGEETRETIQSIVVSKSDCK